MNNYRNFIAEFFGTFILVFIGCGSVMFGGPTISNLEVAANFGITLIVLFYTIGSISGCHVNPAVTISMLLLKRITFYDAFFYVFFQCFGSITASIILYIISIGDFNITLDNLGQNTYIEADNHGYNLFIAFLIELLLSVFFVFTIISAVNSKNVKYAGFVIGFSLIVIHIVGIPITGVSVNPARSIGPALIIGGTALKQLWVFIVAPIVGAIMATGLWKILEVDKEFNRLMNSNN